MSARHLLADQKVPRYTSYPTAPHFHPGVGAQAFDAWLSGIAADEPLSLYLHVPFCTSLCLYCGCHTEAARRKDPLRRYVGLLHREIDLVADRMAARAVRHIHWGGGTPSALGEQALADIADHLRDRFDLDGLREHAIELDPRHVTGSLAQTLARIGINRASLGVQDFSPHVQSAMGRVQPLATVRRAIDALRRNGICRLNFDLMYGLPRQSVADVDRSIELAVSLAPQRVALFGYAHVPWFRPRQRLINEADLPGMAERFRQMRSARERLCRSGYVPIGLDHFALPDDELAIAAHDGRLRRNFQGYTTDDAPTLIGFGASAIGRLPQGFVQNAADVSDYARRIEAGELATARGIALSDDDRLRAGIIEALMCDLRAKLPPQWSGSASAAQAREALLPLAAEGLVRIDPDAVTVTPEGQSFVRLVAAAFDAYLPGGHARHSAAV
jgi:oxygen-independent coproporphyrinogen-3 oxidase